MRVLCTEYDPVCFGYKSAIVTDSPGWDGVVMRTASCVVGTVYFGDSVLRKVWKGQSGTRYYCDQNICICFHPVLGGHFGSSVKDGKVGVFWL